MGVGSELEMARSANKKIILWWHDNKKVSRMAKGNPAVVQKIIIKNKNGLINKIKTAIKKYAK